MGNGRHIPMQNRYAPWGPLAEGYERHKPRGRLPLPKGKGQPKKWHPRYIDGLKLLVNHRNRVLYQLQGGEGGIM